MHDLRVDTILPWTYFAVLAAIGIWLIAKNGQWWNEVVSSNFLPNPTLYYIIWVVFLVIFPFAYQLTLEACKTQGHRISLHLLMTVVFVFLLLWVIFLYKRRDIRVALIFMGIAWFFVLATTVMALLLRSPAAGLWALFLIWLTMVWFLTSSARAEGLNSMYETLRERFQLRQELGSPSLS